MSKLDDSDRARGFLTPDDRDYLDGDKDYTANGERSRRREIRERITNAIKDFDFVVDNLETRDARQILDESPHSREFNNGLKKGFTFLYMCGRYTTLEFDELLEEGLADGEIEYQSRFNHKRVAAEAEVEVKTKDPNSLDDAVERLKNEEPLTVQEIMGLLSFVDEEDIDISHVDKVVYDDSAFKFPVHRERMQENILEPLLKKWHDRPDTVRVERNNPRRDNLEFPPEEDE